MTESLRFGALVRVSTERQGKRGESLRTQEKNIREAVKYLEGEVVKWYKGHEHATEGYERKLFDQLLEDSTTGVFNAVIVDDASRWSRDALTSLQGLRVLRSNNVRFFVGRNEIRLDQLEQIFTIGVLSHASQLQTDLMRKKSIENKIERVRRGWPSSGPLPYGRRVTNKKNSKSGSPNWEVVPEKKAEAERLYDLYVNKKYGFSKVADITGISHHQVRDILLDRCGGTWPISFKLLEKPIEITIPPLLTKDQIAAVKQRAKANQKFRKSKNIYPLAHYVRCADCGRSMYGQQQNERLRYYVHDKSSRRTKSCTCIKSVRADWLESSVFAQIGKMLSKSENVVAAVKRVVQGSEGRKEELNTNLHDQNKRLKDLSVEKKNIVNAIAKGILTDEEAADKLMELRSSLLSTRINHKGVSQISVLPPVLEKQDCNCRLWLGCITN